MAWINPRTWNNGETVSDTMMNTIRDNLNILWPYTTTGDICYRNSSSELSRLGIGSTDQTLTVIGGVPTWVTQPTKVNFMPSGAFAFGNATWLGSAKNVGTYSFYPNDFNSSIPNNIVAMLFTVSAKWASASDGSTLNVSASDAVDNCLLVRGMVANFFNDNTGVVPLGTDGKIYVKVSGANTTSVVLNSWGYFYQ